MNPFDLFSSIRWQDAIDIILNSYIVFRLYALFRGTNVFRVLMGIAFLWFFQRMAVSLDLVVTSWAIQGITAAAALLIIVVFRNEIRSVLQAKNLRAIIWGFPRKTQETPVEIIADGAYELAKGHLGALIVIPGNEDLKEYVHSSIPWYGVLSRQMLISIFWPDNPVHDGAAIIQGNQVKEVGAILPLTHRKDLPSHYGTRHRAAAGLAENTDALVIVVSEERGVVSYAKGSGLRKLNGREELSRIIRAHQGVAEKQSGYIVKGKIELTLAALISVLFISGVWFSFARGLNTSITLEIPIEYMNRSANLEIIDTSLNSARLQLSGSSTLVKSLRPEQVHIRIDLNKAVPGANTYTITQEAIALPPGINLVNIKPQAVEVTLDVLVKMALPVQVDWVGKLRENLILTEARLSPNHVQVIGGSRILEKISTIYTEQVPLEQIEKSGSMVIKLMLPSASLKVAADSKDKVTIEYTINERPSGSRSPQG